MASSWWWWPLGAMGVSLVLALAVLVLLYLFGRQVADDLSDLEDMDVVGDNDLWPPRVA